MYEDRLIIRIKIVPRRAKVPSSLGSSWNTMAMAATRPISWPAAKEKPNIDPSTKHKGFQRMRESESQFIVNTGVVEDVGDDEQEANGLDLGCGGVLARLNVKRDRFLSGCDRLLLRAVLHIA